MGPADEVIIEVWGGIHFIHGGQNLASVACPFCHADLDDWWQDAMNEAWDHDLEAFVDLSCVTPCCSKPTNLNELAYDWPVGFARFRLKAMNPESRGLSPEQIAHLETILGCRLRITWEYL